MLNKLTTISRAAGDEFKKFYYSGVRKVEHKGTIDLVTQYDRILENSITEKLKLAFPDFKIIGEESSLTNPGMQPGKVIYVDPIDGTTNFVHKLPFTCISIGVYVDCKPICGVINDPVLNELYYAEIGKGAYMNDKRISVSSVTKTIDALFSTGFPYDRQEANKSLPIFSKMMSICQGERRTGSAAMDLCYVARGTFDIYYERNLKPWDIAAGILIVQEAGGKVTGLDGNSHDLSENYVVATNQILHDICLKEINNLI